MRRLSRRIRVACMLVTALAGAALVPACSGEEAQFEVSYAHAPNPKKPASFSILGVFRDGRLSPDMWAAIDRGLGMQGCETAFGPELRRQQPKLFADTDAYARKNGPDDPMFEPFIALAEGETIMLLHVIGRPPVGASSVNPSSDTGSAPPPMMGRSPGGRMGGGGIPRGSPRHTEAEPTFDVVATFYSKTEKRSIAAVAMRYSGKSMDEALGKFRDKLLLELPGVKCSGWKLAAPAPSASASAAASISAPPSASGEPK